ncbi:alpha/beta fold hydrolase [Oceanobacillus polygoni]|uniref:Pimeloyl-ACP methyl ester carboxylesterase n=1 Tax=Oceanobacillus polygoni TaxID=1235259 RepID=A0A9X0YTN2_9BACI|nr:alpha/beta hydrolase [Oceanobacillus polygoni]MBP2076816.1 pimeloyl-ACP methyl ester carboxylesterase [Oceanobacillus polygoni]
MILHTEKSGDGETIIFLHTGLQTGRTELTEQDAYFREKYQVILPDLRGHGKSVSEAYSNYFKESANDLLETADHLGIASAHVAGCSLGALVALVFAKIYPKRVKSLILSGIIPEKPLDWEAMEKEDAEQEAKILAVQANVDYFDKIHHGDWRKLLQSTREADWYPFDETGDLSELSMPVLFIVGEANQHETVGAIKYPNSNENIHVAERFQLKRLY